MSSVTSTAGSSRLALAGPSTSTTDALHEYFVSVEIHTSKSTAAVRKPQLGPKRNVKSSEKRDSLKTSTSFNDLNARKIKEKASWLSLSRSSGNTEQWRHATCKLVEEEDRCVLKIYLEETILYQTVHINQLHHTDIRPIHRSLFDRNDCLGIFCTPEATFSFNPTSEPLYLAFPDADLLNIWIALLRSYASPEVYGRWIYAEEGGLYRMWRQIEMTCIQGRNLGTLRLPEELGESEGKQEDPVDIDVYCQIIVNGHISGRTTIKKGLGSPDWQEKFKFLDLPPFGTLEILVLKDKKLTKPVAIGSVVIALMNFRRREYVEGWFPVLSTQHHAGIVVGELRLRIRVDEEIILPKSLYSEMLQAMKTINYLDWIEELDSRFKVRQIVQEHFVSIAHSQNALADNIKKLIDREVNGSPQSHTTLFRGNSNLTKTMEAYMSTYGGSFIEASVGNVLRRICAERVTIETDSNRTRKNGKTIEKNVELLAYWCQELWKSIYDARRQCPEEMREIFIFIRSLIETRYQEYAELPWQGVSAFLFLRFFVPRIMYPHMHGLWPGMPDEQVGRTLTQIAKVVQSLANLNVTVAEPDNMRAVQDFLASSSPKMLKYLDAISSKNPDPVDAPRPLSSASQRHARKQLISVVKHRGRSAPTLNREAIPVLPQMIDLPKHLAVITSIVVRHTRRTLPTRTGAPVDRFFDEFCQKCLEVEEQALIRVSQLASHGKARRKLSSTADLTFLSSPPESPVSPRAAHQRERRISVHNETRKLKKLQRPSSAPGDAGSRPPASPLQMSQPPSPALQSATTRAQSHELPRRNTKLLEPHSLAGLDVPGPLATRPPLVHHPRSTSTDSGFSHNDHPLQPPSGATITSLTSDILPGESEEEANRRKKGLLRGFLRK